MLKEEGFILDYQVGEVSPDEQGHQTFNRKQDAIGSKADPACLSEVWPRRRKGHSPYRAGEQARPAAVPPPYDLRPVLDGLGIAVISTSQGVMSDRQARAQRLGGELLCTVW